MWSATVVYCTGSLRPSLWVCAVHCPTMHQVLICFHHWGQNANSAPFSYRFGNCVYRCAAVLLLYFHKNLGFAPQMWNFRVLLVTVRQKRCWQCSCPGILPINTFYTLKWSRCRSKSRTCCTYVAHLYISAWNCVVLMNNCSAFCSNVWDPLFSLDVPSLSILYPIWVLLLRPFCHFL